MAEQKKYFITGGAGFIGAHLVNHLLDNTDSKITVYDNFQNGRLYHFGEKVNSPRLKIIEGDVKDLEKLLKDKDYLIDTDTFFNNGIKAEFRKVVIVLISCLLRISHLIE